jgi:hypothetical protein
MGVEMEKKWSWPIVKKYYIFFVGTGAALARHEKGFQVSG